MTLRTILIFFLMMAVALACSDLSDKNNKSKEILKMKSRVSKFEYGGYGDANKAFIYGSIYEYDTTHHSKDTLKPLQNVSIKIEQTNQIIFTDTAGQFELGFDKGVFRLFVTKQGYQSLRLTNYVSDPDQISNTKIILEKGNDLQTFEISKR